MREGWCRLPSKNCDLVLNEGRKFYVPTGIGTNTGKCSHKEYIEDTYTFFLDGKEYKPQPE